MKIKTIISTILLCFAFVGNAFAKYEQELIEACEMGNFRDAKKYLELGANPDVTKTKGEFTYSALAFACKKKNLDLVKVLVTKEAAVNAPDEKGVVSPLAIAAKAGARNIVQYLLEDCGCSDLNGKDEEGSTAFMNIIKLNSVGLFYAACNNCKTIEVNHANSFGYTAVSFAIQRCDTQIVRGLVGTHRSVSEKPNLNHYIQNEGCNEFQYALKLGIRKTIECLIEEDSDLASTRDDDGIPPLLWAVKNRLQKNIIEALLNFAPECVDSQDKYGKDVFDYLKKYESKNSGEIADLCYKAKDRL